MKLKLFGCCSGIEPVPKYNHTSFAFETGGEVYWFDAGEGCSDTAHLMGVDLTRVSNIFISHTHMDCVGGLFNLLWFMFKLSGWYQKPLPNDGKIGLFIPNSEAWKGILQMLMHTREGCPWDTDVLMTQIKSGLLYQDKNIEVTAFANGHPHSFSFRIKGDGKTVVYSGDIKELSDLDAALQMRCDYLLVETEHHAIKDVCEYVNTKAAVENVIFLHHGQEVSCDIQKSRLIAQEYANCNVFFGEDGDSINL